MENKPIIMCGCPVRNRGWILPQYLKNIYKIDYPKKKLILCFILNDSTIKKAQEVSSETAQREIEKLL